MEPSRVAASSAPAGSPSREEVFLLPSKDLVALFRTLSSPTLEEMEGEYRATLLDQGSTTMQLLGLLALNLPGRWVAKAFESLGSGEGHGYNLFQGPGGFRRAFRMRTFVGPSLIDSGNSYHLDYSAYNRGPIKTMYDEIRRVSPGLYLGLGRIGFTERQRRNLGPFLLEGPIGPFHPSMSKG